MKVKKILIMMLGLGIIFGIKSYSGLSHHFSGGVGTKTGELKEWKSGATNHSYRIVYKWSWGNTGSYVGKHYMRCYSTDFWGNISKDCDKYQESDRGFYLESPRVNVTADPYRHFKTNYGHCK
ncbi:MAG: hypothetical protein Q4B84_02595 [Clostridia bacterium]|nr:hypothetical protein [Clostridia bacterium]